MLNPYIRCSAAIVLLFSMSVPWGVADDFDNLAQNLVKIRAQVEALHTQLDLDKQDHKNEISSLTSQITDLEVEKRRKSMIVEQLRNKIADLQVSEDATHRSSDDISPVLLATLAALKTHIRQGLPFKASERLAVVETLEKQLIRHTTAPRKVANKLWALIEDEIRLSKENGLYQQTIMLKGENRLADVAKIGMMYLYFKTRDDQVGMAQPLNGQWHYETVNEPIAQQQVETLFDALKKQVRQGFFELPNPSRS